MTPVRMTILGVALVAGVGSVALLARSMASSQDRARPVIVAAAAPAPAPTVRVLVAKRDLEVGDRIAPEDMSWQPWPAASLNPAFITDGPVKPAPAPTNGIAAAGRLAQTAAATLANPAEGAGAQMVGAIVRDKILSGEPLIQAKVVHAGQAGVMAVTLDPGTRAMALPLSAESAAGGFILPGDHVDVVLSRQVDSVNGGPRTFATSTVMKNVKVLAVDQNTGAQKSTAVVGATATVEVTPAQAELLVLAKAQGSLTLVLRSYADAAGSAQAGDIDSHTGQADLVVKVFRNGAPTPVTVSR